MRPSQIESSYNFATMWYHPLQCDTVRFILTSVIIVNWNVFEGEKGPRNVHKEDKKMRGHSNVTMCEWLINSFFTFFLRSDDLHSAEPWRRKMLISKWRKMSVCISEELLLCSLSLFWGWNSFRMCFQAHFGALIYLVAMNYWRGNFYPWVTPPGSWPAEHPARKLLQKLTAHIVSYLAVDCNTAL